MKSFIKALLMVVFFQASVAMAAGEPFTQAKFDARVKEGKAVVVHVHAPWCPTCKAQDPIVSKMMKAPEYSKVAFLEVDFDQQKPVLKEMNVSMQSTLIVFKDGKEVGRSTGETKPAAIEALIQKVQ